MEPFNEFSDWAAFFKEISQPEGIVLGTADLVKATGVSSSQIRYWVQQGYVKTVDDDEKRSHKFSYRAVFRVRAIKYFLDKGYTLAFAAEQVSYFNRLNIRLQQIVLDRMTDMSADPDGNVEISLGSVDQHDELKLTLTPEGQTKFWTVRHEAPDK